LVTRNFHDERVLCLRTSLPVGGNLDGVEQVTFSYGRFHVINSSTNIEFPVLRT